MRRTHAVAASLLSALVAAPVAAGAARWTAPSAEAAFRLVHKLHDVVGKSAQVEVVAVLDDGGLKVMARAPVASFDSGNGNRDAHMLEVLEAQRFPLVVVKAAAPGFGLPAPGTKTEVRLRGEVELHGVKAEVPVMAEIEVLATGRAVVRFRLATSLTAHRIERPSLLFVPVEDELAVSGAATLEPGP